MRLYDDNNDGIADANAVTQLIRDGSAKVLGYIGPVYNVDLIDPLSQAEVVRLTLDVCQAYAAQRHPEILRVEGYKMMAQAEKDLKQLREGLTNLGITGVPEPAANQGARVLSGNPNSSDFTPRFSDNWGGRGGF
jgi:hypothetical protein